MTEEMKSGRSVHVHVDPNRTLPFPATLAVLAFFGHEALSSCETPPRFLWRS